MKKKLVLLITTSAATSLAIAALALSPKLLNSKKVKGDPSYTMVIDGGTQFESIDEGIVSQATIKGNKIDFVGFSKSGGSVGSISSQVLSGTGLYGLVYNRSIINGFTSLKVVYGGVPLYYTFTEFLMEDMSLNGANTVISGQTYNVPAGCGYFMLYNPTDQLAGIDRIEITYACQGDLDAQMIFNKESDMGGARSLAGKTVLEDSYVELTNNPTRYTNNYSQGKHEGHTNNDSWYRWNGRYFANSANLGTEFTFGMTIMGEYSSWCDESQYFHYNVWPQFTYGNANDRPWLQTYIGNDNYEPLGKDHALRPDDPYVQHSYEGRFFTDYVYEDGDWVFANPDTHYIPDPNHHLTLREAYNWTTLPFWFLKFHVYLTEVDEVQNVPVCDVYINGLLIYEQVELFDNYDTVNTPSISIYTMPMHLVNYGVDIDATPAEAYTGCFTYPRLITE